MAKQTPPKSPAKAYKPAAPVPSGAASLPPLVKQLLLTLPAILILFLIFQFPRHDAFLQTVKRYYKEKPELARQKDEGKRMEMRHGENYALPQAIQKMVKPTDIFLLPPKNYVTKYSQNPNNWSNPYVFYYMADKVRTCPVTDTVLRRKTTLAAVYNDGKNKGWGLVPFTNDSIRAEIIKEYEKIK